MVRRAGAGENLGAVAPSPQHRPGRNTNGGSDLLSVVLGNLFHLFGSGMDIICVLPVLLIKKNSNELIQLGIRLAKKFIRFFPTS